jgi:hypothetical protein
MLPKSTLREFTFNNWIYYLDLKDNVNKTSSAKGYNTAVDYYPDETENLLSKEVETQIGKLRKQLKDYELGLVGITISPELTKLLIQIFIVQTMRVPDLSRYVHSNSVFASILGLPEGFYSVLHHDIGTICYSINNAYSDITASILKGYSVNIIEIPKDHRERSFVLPSSHFIGFGKCLMLVLNPYWGIILVPESVNKHLLHEGKLIYLAATNDEGVDQINQEAMKYESILSIPRLVGLPSELERIKQK